MSYRQLAGPAILTLVCAAFAVACGGGSSTPNIASNRADAYAHDALIQVADLGPGWELIADDNFGTGTPGATPGTASGDTCDTSASSETDKAIAATRIARARRNLNLALPGDVLTVQVDVAVYKDEASAKRAVDNLNASTNTPEYEKCFESHFASTSDPNASLNVVKGTTTVPTLNGGFATVYTLRPPGAAEGSGLRLEAHIWHLGNVVFALQATGAEANVSADTVRTLLAKFGARAGLAATPGATTPEATKAPPSASASAAATK